MVGLRIAVRYLFARKSHKAVNIISRISVAGVAVATAAIICVLSVFNGFRQIAESRLSKLDADLRVTPVRGKVIDHADSLVTEIAGMEGIETCVPVIEERVLAVSQGRQLPIVIKGVPDDYTSVSAIDEIVIDGDFDLEGDDFFGSAVLSVGTATTLDARPNLYNLIYLYAPRRVGRINPANPSTAFRVDTLLVAGVYSSGQSEYDVDRIYAPLDNARRLLDYTDEATALEIALTPGLNPTTIAANIQKTIGTDFKVSDRLQQQETSFRMISIEKWVTFALLAFVLIIASFNIISTLSMLIIEKRDNIRTLRHLGATDRSIGSIFAWEGWLISLLGGIIGIAIGLLLCYAQQWGGFIKLNGDPTQLSITVYPVHVAWTDVAIVFSLLCVVGLLVALISSRFANKLTR